MFSVSGLGWLQTCDLPASCTSQVLGLEERRLCTTVPFLESILLLLGLELRVCVCQVNDLLLNYTLNPPFSGYFEIESQISCPG